MNPLQAATILTPAEKRVAETTRALEQQPGLEGRRSAFQAPCTLNRADHLLPHTSQIHPVTLRVPPIEAPCQ